MEMIKSLSRYQIGQTVRDDGPETHFAKAGTPTMGGGLLLVAIAIATLLWADLASRVIWVTLIVTLLFGLVGWLIIGPSSEDATVVVTVPTLSATAAQGVCRLRNRRRKPRLRLPFADRCPCTWSGVPVPWPVPGWEGASRPGPRSRRLRPEAQSA